MANKVWRGSADFEAFTHTNAGPLNNRLYFGGPGNGFTDATKLTRLGGTADNNFVSVFSNGAVKTMTGSAITALVVTGAALQNGTVRGEMDVTQNAGGNARRTFMTWRFVDINNFYQLHNTANTLYFQKIIGGVSTVLGSTARTQDAAGTRQVLQCASTGSSHTITVQSPGSPVSVTVTDNSLAAGGTYGIVGGADIYNQTCVGCREISTATTGVSRSTTFDAGSSSSADVLHVEGVSLPSGSAVVRLSAVASGAPNFSTTVTLTGASAEDITFTALTGRYWQVECSFPDGGSLTAVGFDKGNDAGGGATIYSSGGRSGQRTKKVYVAVPLETIKKLKNSFS